MRYAAALLAIAALVALAEGQDAPAPQCADGTAQGFGACSTVTSRCPSYSCPANGLGDLLTTCGAAGSKCPTNQDGSPITCSYFDASQCNMAVTTPTCFGKVACSCPDVNATCPCQSMTMLPCISFGSATTFRICDGTCPSGTVYYKDQKQNCNATSTSGSYCYCPPNPNPKDTVKACPRLDASGKMVKSCKVPGTFALTFDDGPHPDFTPKVLDALKQYGMKATFFLIGYYINNYPWVVQRILDEGHQIGIHTQDHITLQGLTPEQAIYQINAWERTMMRFQFKGPVAGGLVPTYFRPPRGAMDQVAFDALAPKNLTYAHWGYLNSDQYYFQAPDIVKVHKSHFGWTQNGTVDIGAGAILGAPYLVPIVQQHDNALATADSFAEVVQYYATHLQSRGVRFVTLAECLGDPNPPYKPGTPLITDPDCSSGIWSLVNGRVACCPKGCGYCGGCSCSTFPGGATNCCANNVLTTNVSCSVSDAPCVINGAGGAPPQANPATKTAVAPCPSTTPTQPPATSPSP